MKEDLVTNILINFSTIKDIKDKAYNKMGFSQKPRKHYDEMLLDIFFEMNKDFHSKGEDFYAQKILIENDLESKIEELYIYSMDNNFFYFDCPFKVYENQFENRKQIYFKKNIDANQQDFLLSEIDYFSHPKENRIIGEDGFYSSYITYSEKYRLSYKRKIEFLSEKLEDFGYRIEYDEFPHFSENTAFGKISIIEEKVSIDDKSPLNKLTGNQIVLLLQEIGFFTHPKIEDATKGKQAKLIGLLVGLNQKNIKTNIQKLDKKPSENGLNYQKDIEKINKVLDDLI